MYVAGKGGEAAIDNAHKLLAERRRRNHLMFPMGVDFFLVAGNDVVGLPRSTKVDG